MLFFHRFFFFLHWFLLHINRCFTVAYYKNCPSRISADLRPLHFLSSGSVQLKEDSTDIFNNFFFLSWEVSASGSWLFTFFENLQSIILWAGDRTRNKNNSPFQLPSRTENGKFNHLEQSGKTRCGLIEPP